MIMKKLSDLVGVSLLIAVAGSLLSAQPAAQKDITVTQEVKTSTVEPQQQNVPAKDIIPQVGTHQPANPIVEHLQYGMILDYATFLVAAITAIFAIFASFLGIFEWRRVEALKKEVAAERKELHEARKAFDSRIETSKFELLAQAQGLRKELDEERKAIEARIETFNARIEAFKSGLEAQEQRLHANQRFLEAVLSHHSRLLVGIVEGFGSALNPDEVTRFNSLISEAESALDLFRPDKAVVRRALLNLEHIGSDGSVSSLVQLRDDPTEEKEICIQAQKVLMIVKERLNSERHR